MNYADIPGMNWSSLKAMATSPLLYQWRTTHPRPDTAAMLLGRAIHAAVLEPASYNERYAVEPEWQHRGNSKLGKAERADWKIIYSDHEKLTAAQHATAQLCAASVRNHVEASRLLSGGRAEETATWTDGPTGIACKGRLDYVGPGWIADLKSASDLDWFDRDAARRIYHGQMAWYKDGAVLAHAVPSDAEVWMIVVETVEPYDVEPVRVPAIALDAGRRLYRRLLDTWRECEAAGLWPGRTPRSRELELPNWAAGMDYATAEVW